MSGNSIRDQDYNSFKAFLEEACGIVLGDNKQYLVSSRLGRLLKEMELDSVGDLIEKMRQGSQGRLRAQVIDAMTTNETFWFRDNHPYLVLQELVYPELAKQRPTEVRVWSAACSSGQEPYSISIASQEYLMSRPGSLPNNIQIIATDLSPSMLAQARAARYDDLAVSRGLSQERKERFFRQDGTQWEVKEHIRNRVRFSELNLMNTFASLGKFDVIFCRNVLIYFSSELKADILKRVAMALRPGGFLFLGATETLASYSDQFDAVRHNGGIVYQLKGK